MNDASHSPASGSASIAGRVLRGVLSVLAILMCALALGAVLALLSLFAGIRPCWLMLVGAPLLVLVLLATGSLQGRIAPAAAAFAVLLAGGYAECLDAVARIAALTGATFTETLHTGGIALTMQVAELGLSPLNVMVYAAAAIIGVWLARSRTQDSGI